MSIRCRPAIKVKIHLGEISSTRTLEEPDFSEQYPHDFHVIQTDNASFHRSNDLVMPDNVMLLYQPPHSPQVNSAEQLWDWSKDEIANRIFPGLDALKLTLKELFLSKQKAFFSVLRGFLWSRSQACII